MKSRKCAIFSIIYTIVTTAIESSIMSVPKLPQNTVAGKGKKFIVLNLRNKRESSYRQLRPLEKLTPRDYSLLFPGTHRRINTGEIDGKTKKLHPGRQFNRNSTWPRYTAYYGNEGPKSSQRSFSDTKIASVYSCEDDHICKVLDLNEAACGVQDIKEKCCRSCTKCIDESICQAYTPISIFCRISSEIRKNCPMSCGFCSPIFKLFAECAVGELPLEDTKKCTKNGYTCTSADGPWCCRKRYRETRRCVPCDETAYEKPKDTVYTTKDKCSYETLGDNSNSSNRNVAPPLSPSQECCKTKGVSKLCLGLCEIGTGRSGSLSRNLRCTAYQKQMEECTNVGPASIEPPHLSQSKECCERQGVSKLCLGLCESANGQSGSLSRNLRCNAYRKQMETCIKENDASLVKDRIPGKIKVDLKMDFNEIKDMHVTEGQRCCQRKGVSKLCLGFCDNANGESVAMSRGGFRCSEYEKEIAACWNAPISQKDESSNHPSAAEQPNGREFDNPSTEPTSLINKNVKKSNFDPSDSTTTEIAINCQNDYECCCQEKGVEDYCWGYCVDRSRVSARELIVLGVCEKMMPQINDCIKGPKVDARILSEEGSDGEKGHILPFGEGGPERSPHFTGTQEILGSSGRKVSPGLKDGRFIREEGQTCEQIMSNYGKITGTAETALSTCFLDRKCKKVLDDNCDGKPPFFFCTEEPNKQPSGFYISSCIYKKSQIF